MGLIFWFRLVSCKPSQLSTLVHPICSTPSSPDTKDAARKSRRWIRIWIDVPSDAQDHCRGQRFHGIKFIPCLHIVFHSICLLSPASELILPCFQSLRTAYVWKNETLKIAKLGIYNHQSLLFVNPQQIPVRSLRAVALLNEIFPTKRQCPVLWGSTKHPLGNCQPFGQASLPRKMASYELLCSPFRSRNFRQVHCLVIFGTNLVICVCIQATKPPMWWLAGRYWLKLFCTATQVPCTSACNCDLIIWWIIQCSNASNLAIWCYVDMLDDR